MFVRYLKSMSVEMVERVERVSGLAVDIAHDYGMAASDRAVAGPAILPISIHLVGWHQACGQFLVAWPAGLAGRWPVGVTTCRFGLTCRLRVRKSYINTKNVVYQYDFYYVTIDLISFSYSDMHCGLICG
jgi:hypothetical protein